MKKNCNSILELIWSQQNPTPKKYWVVVGTLLVTLGLLSIALGTYVFMKKFITFSTIHFKIRLYENYTPKYKSTFYPWKVNIRAQLLETGYTRATIEVIRNWGAFDPDVITSFPQGFMINMYKDFEIERWESNLVHRVKADVPVPDHPGWRTTKVAQETPLELPMHPNVEDKLFDMVGPTYIFHLAELKKVDPPIDSLNEYFLHVAFYFISREPLMGYNRLIRGQIRVNIHGGVREYEFKGVGKSRSGNTVWPHLQIYDSEREEQNIKTLFYWQPQIQGRFSVPEKMVGAKQFGEMAQAGEAIKGGFVYETSAAYWISFLGAILGLPMCGGGGKLIQRFFKHVNEKRGVTEKVAIAKEMGIDVTNANVYIKHPEQKKILIFSTNPKDTRQLRLDEEVREIEEGLNRAKRRDQFIIHQKWALRIWDLRRALLDYEPQIVHFAGHGKRDGLIVENERGNAVRVHPGALSGLFKLCSDYVECVLLNACYSKSQAEAINEHIAYVIGMRRKIEDKAAMEFAVGFYDALGAGKSVEEAFEFGCNAIQFKFPDIPQHLIPVLIKRQEG